MKICIIASNYPTGNNHVHIFLKNVVTEFVDRGIECNVIAPQSIIALLFKRKKSRKFISERKTNKGNKYMVFSPIYFVFPKIKFAGFNFSDLTKKSFIRSVFREYKKRKISADVIYSHFIHAGIAGVALAHKLKIPSFIANGECDTAESVKYLSAKFVDETLKNVTGIISVSSKNKNEILDMCNNDQFIANKITVIPNSVDTTKFYKKDKKQCRKALGFPLDEFIISFTGSFIERKGVKLLSEVIDKMDNVYSIFIGRGNQPPTCKNILFCGSLNNAEICDYLNASDVFVLPTLAEGCSNAIVEALACGLPIVSSDLPFNDDILDETCSIKIDPLDARQIKEAINVLKEDSILREQLSHGSLKKAESLKLSTRVDKILTFINKKSVNK